MNRAQSHSRLLRINSWRPRMVFRVSTSRRGQWTLQVQASDKALKAASKSGPLSCDVGAVSHRGSHFCPGLLAFIFIVVSIPDAGLFEASRVSFGAGGRAKAAGALPATASLHVRAQSPSRRPVHCRACSTGQGARGTALSSVTSRRYRCGGQRKPQTDSLPCALPRGGQDDQCFPY